ncbi:MAG: UDP-N-acetylglucosamine 2-epimerase (non-hydrolyzing) [Lutibacter sp.]|nr:MAG: UDP-N-acetylglucosamine 2-epimerase (non-hydrolyzing) [Lutibacter sp.]
MKKKILIVVGTRPNFVKITRFKLIAKKYKNLDLRIVHTGQHYDEKMSEVFLRQFHIEVDYFLNITESTPNSLIGEVILKLENVINEFHPDLLLSVGDVNSTLAASITANKLGVKLGHIESGLRSFDKEMPEEINRIITDGLSDICFVTEKSGIKNLKAIEKNESQIAFVGNTMIDTLIHFEKDIEGSVILDDIEITKHSYILVTMHRPRNVDNKRALLKIVDLFSKLSQNYQIVFSMHPRTKKNFEKFGLLIDIESLKNITIISPQNYFSFQKLIKYSFCVITDSGGIQEETTFQKVPCITLRKNTERPITIEQGTNVLMPFESEKILSILNDIETGNFKKGIIPELWDGKATERILMKCIDYIG